MVKYALNNIKIILRMLKFMWKQNYVKINQYNYYFGYVSAVARTGREGGIKGSPTDNPQIP